jgi:hypothetical protein
MICKIKRSSTEIKDANVIYEQVLLGSFETVPCQGAQNKAEDRNVY